MKIGLSYSRCVRDIVDEIVDIADVLIIIARTDFDPKDDKQWKGIWAGYHDAYGLSLPEWFNYPVEDEDRFRSVSIELWETGRLHQPRKFGAHPKRLPYHWLEAIPTVVDIDKNPTLKKAWEQFQVVSGLSDNITNFNDNF
jgi:hypothetical protein